MSATLSPALGLDASRALDPARHTIAGHAPRAAVRPATREEAAEAMRAAARDGLAVVPWGGGVALPFEAAPARYDVALDLRGLDRVVEYEPDDLTLTAECGATIASLRQTLAARGQELPLEAAHAARATLGGTLAANAAGARRRALGAPRDRILGARFLLGDGTIARSGGKVVKNVAGYGVHRLLCDSRGGLAIVLEASLKLQPAPATRLGLIFAADEAQLADTTRWAPLDRLELAALSIVSTASGTGIYAVGAPFLVVAGCEGEAGWVAEQERAVCDALGTPLARRTAGEAELLWTRLEDLEEQPGARLTFATADCTPAALTALNALAPGIPLVFHAPAGRLMLWPRPGELGVIREAFASGASFTAIDSRPGDDVGGEAPPAVAEMRRALREAFDPAGRFALGQIWADRAL